MRPRSLSWSGGATDKFRARAKDRPRRLDLARSTRPLLLLLHFHFHLSGGGGGGDEFSFACSTRVGPARFRLAVEQQAQVKSGSRAALGQLVRLKADSADATCRPLASESSRPAGRLSVCLSIRPPAAPFQGGRSTSSQCNLSSCLSWPKKQASKRADRQQEGADAHR